MSKFKLGDRVMHQNSTATIVGISTEYDSNVALGRIAYEIIIQFDNPDNGWPGYGIQEISSLYDTFIPSLKDFRGLWHTKSKALRHFPNTLCNYIHDYLINKKRFEPAHFKLALQNATQRKD